MAALLNWFSLFVNLPGNPVVGWILVSADVVLAVTLAIRAVGKREASHGVGYLIALGLAVLLFATFVFLEWCIIQLVILVRSNWLWLFAIVAIITLLGIAVVFVCRKMTRPL